MGIFQFRIDVYIRIFCTFCRAAWKGISASQGLLPVCGNITPETGPKIS